MCANHITPCTHPHSAPTVSGFEKPVLAFCFLDFSCHILLNIIQLLIEISIPPRICRQFRLIAGMCLRTCGTRVVFALHSVVEFVLHTQSKMSARLRCTGEDLHGIFILRNHCAPVNVECGIRARLIEHIAHSFDEPRESASLIFFQKF